MKIKSRLTNTAEKRRLILNIFSLSALQGVNYILPLITLPYLVRILGPEYFGLLAFATATISYFMIITDYGFNLSATRQVSIHRNDTKKINEIFSSVMIIKMGLMIISLILMILIIFSFERFSEHWDLYLITFGVVIGQVISPIWLFQGLECMKYITYINIGAKTFFILLVFIFVKKPDDYLLVPLFTSLGFILAGCWSIYLAKKKFNVNFRKQNLQTLKLQLVDGWHVFFSSIAISLYTISTIFILGLFANNVIVGYFSAADKIVQAVKGLYSPISQAIYPLISKKIHDDKQVGMAFIRKITWILSSIMLFNSTILFLSSEFIVNILLGEQYKQSILILKIMAFLPFIITLSNIFGIQTMLNLGYHNKFMEILVFSSIIAVILSFIFVPYFDAYASAVIVLFTEITVTVLMGKVFIGIMNEKNYSRG